MLLDPLTQFVRKLVVNRGGRRRKLARPSRSTRRRMPGTGYGTWPAAPAELLEERTLLSGPQLITVAPNTGGFLTSNQLLTEAPQELTFTFSPGASINPSTLAAGISVTRSGGDGSFNSGNEQTIAPGFLGLVPGTNNQVTLRFASTLPDDFYRITIDGDLKNTLGESFNNGTAQNLDFRVDYGTQVVSIVPQPVLRDPGTNVLSQQKDTILVYFNQNPLNPTLAQDPGFYQVINTTNGSILLPNSVVYDSVANTATLKFAQNIPTGTFKVQIGAPASLNNTLDTAVNAGTLFSNTGGFTTTGFLGNENHVSTDANDFDLYAFRTGATTNVNIQASNLGAGLGGNVLLRLFNSAGVEIAKSTTPTLNQLIVNGLSPNATYYVGVSSVNGSGVGNTAYNPVNGTAAANGVGTGTYRLSIAVTNQLPVNNNTDTTSFGTANNVGTLGAAGQIINDVIQPLPGTILPTLPGGPDQPGARQTSVAGENNNGVPLQTYGTTNIETFLYNFQDVYGTDINGNILHNAITPEQKDLARQIFQIYSEYLGIEFIETADQGLTVVTGVVSAVDPTIPPDSVGGIFGPSTVGTVDAIVNASQVPGGSSQYGGAWWEIAFHEIGHALGLEHSFHAPSVMGSGLAGTNVEQVYPGDINLVPAENLHPADSTDINLYKFQLTQAGTFSAETVAQRLKSGANDDPSLLDSVITVYQEVGGVRTIVARNDDYFGRDSFVNLHLDAGTYYVAVTSTGNTAFDPSVLASGLGGRTDGSYQLKLGFVADAPSSALLNDTNDVALDGDADAKTGGVFNFWFQSGNTIFVDKASTAAGPQTGTLANPYKTISAALAAATPGSIVRIVGNGGTDGNVATTNDNLPYLIGFDSQNFAAADGSTFIVPKGVTVMIDAGAIIKLRSAIIDVGNSLPGVDRSGGSLQVLGTPTRNVIFTSLTNSGIAGNTDPTNFLGPQAGNWGGLVFRQSSDVQGLDWQGNGIFLNSVNQANMTYGGGQLLDDSVPTTFAPIHIANPNGNSDFFARPTIWNNTISLSAGAALSADPNSFFNSPDRAGPEIHGNRLVNNSVNAAFIRIRTKFGESVDKLQVPARIDDTDIVYTLTENLLIDGKPGGPSLPNPFGAPAANWDARVAGGLVIDPGVILKLSGSRIEAQVGGSQLIAEGTDAHPIIFTSLKDDTYGAGGTFDTNNNGASVGAAGDYGGLFFNAGSSGSVDHAVIQFAGGTVPISGAFAAFNPVEIQQAAVRITNSLFRNNASGDALGSTRNGLLANAAATIFIRGAQPVIVNNIFQNNQGDILSVNVNALNSLLVSDWGRSTGVLDAFTQFVNNHGPLVRLNTFAGNGTNGMAVRGETITTESVWDDADIVHLLRNQVADTLNLYTYGGIRLESSQDESLVVKLSGANAGFVINGTPLDIDDRIGGSLQVVGNAGHPVVFTSLADDTVGAGFRPDGQPQLDTNGDGAATLPAPGDWNSINFLQYSNDTNVAVALERERVTDPDNNGTPAKAEFLGNLAPDTASDTPDNHKAGNEDQPLGFQVRGFLKTPGDLDVYSFNAAGGTEVWFDISRTSTALDTVLELIDSNGVVLAASDDSQSGAGLTGLALGLIKDPHLGGDFYTTNPRDAGFRVILPGAAGVTGTYFIRVKSYDATGDTVGDTQGEYLLQIRTQQVYEHPGSTVRFADIRYATNGIEIHGLPDHSPLAGTTASAGNNNTFGTAQPLGNLLTSDQNTISVAGSLATSGQVDWYQFTLNYNLIEAIAGVNGGDKTWASIFDIDYADGLARPDLKMSIFDAAGNLILVSHNSDVADDQPGPLQGNDLDDLSRGSVGKLDPFIGSVQMPTGASRTYFVAISSNTRLPQALDATITGTNTNAAVRLEPISSVRRIVEDHIGFTGYTSGSVGEGISTSVQPVSGPILPIATSADLALTVRPFSLADVGLYITGTNGSTINSLRLFNPFDGTAGPQIGQMVNQNTALVGDIQFRSDGLLFAYQGNVAAGNAPNNAGQMFAIDPQTATEFALGGNDGIPDLPPPVVPPPVPLPPPNPQQITTNTVDSFFWVRNNPNAPRPYDLFLAVHDDTTGTSRLYQADPATGSAAVVQGQPWGVIGDISVEGTNIGFTTGMVLGNDGNVYGITSNGYLIQIDPSSITPITPAPTTPPTTRVGVTIIAQPGGNFAGLTKGPQNAVGGVADTPGYYRDMLFAVTTNGVLRAFDTAGNAQAVFAGGATSVQTSLTNVTGLTFSPLDFNLWHPTTQRATDAGHGINPAFDNSRGDTLNWLFSVTGGDSSRTTTEGAGGASFYFGMENWVQGNAVNQPGALNYMTYNGVNAQYGILTDEYHQDLTIGRSAGGFTPQIGNNYNMPGGASGSLITRPFSLATYSNTDLPTLYFDYFLDTQNGAGSSITPNMVDDARVLVSVDGGVTWSLLASNNSTRSTPGNLSDLPQYATEQGADARYANPANPALGAGGQHTQELYDNTGVWRQARVDLSNFAGFSNVQLRFDFSTSGTSKADFTHTEALPGDVTGRGPTRIEEVQDNNHIGFYVDNVMVGLAGRGEMVTGTTAGTNGFFAPAAAIETDPNLLKQQLTGTYQLEVRRGTEYTYPPIAVNQFLYRDTIQPGSSLIAIDPSAMFDVNTPLSDGYSLQFPGGSAIGNGSTLFITDGVKSVNFEFRKSGLPSGSNVAINISNGQTATSIAQQVRDAINNQFSLGTFGVNATLGDTATTTTSLSESNTTVVLFHAVGAVASDPDILEQSYDRLGDKNLPRRQGVINITSNTIRNVLNTGILVSSPARDNGAANTPHPNSVINTPTLNADRLVPGPQISNNVIYNFGTTGIQFSGDPNAAGQALAAAPFGRLTNNTIYGGSSPTGTGILVSNNAAPTILNNIVSNTVTGISVDASSTSRTVIGTSLFKGNTANGVTGTNAIFLGAAQALFVNPATGNFYLAPGSQAIDSSLNTLGDRPAITSVKSPLGIPESPIVAPLFDRFSQLRVDDPSVPNANGLGTDIFKDRGAIERADFVGPTAKLAVPLDNDPTSDGNPAAATVFIISPTPLPTIEVELQDNGIGIDNATVLPSAFTLKQNGVTLVNGVDYIFSYNANTHRVAFQSVSVFPPSATYTIQLDTNVIKDTAGNALQGNQPDGTSLFTIIGNDSPHLTIINTLDGLKNITRDIPFAELEGASNLTVVAGHTKQFLIKQVLDGVLTISKGGNPPVSAGAGTIVADGDVLHWQPTTGATGPTGAFSVVGYDPENAILAPLLSESFPAVVVAIDLKNQAPVLTAIAPLGTATEDTPFVINYSALVAAAGANLSDPNNDTPLSFRIETVTSGTLEIKPNGAGSFSPVDEGTTIFATGDQLRWTPAANDNNELHGGSPVSAFTVTATDGQSFSTPPVQVSVNVTATPDAPTLDALGTFGLAGINSRFRITYADLVAKSTNFTNPDGHEADFRIEGVVSGTLEIRKGGVGAFLPAGTGTVVQPGDFLYWTSPAAGTGLSAFNIVAFDTVNSAPFDKSTPTITAKVDVLNSVSPTLTTVTTLVRPQFVPSIITHADLVAAANETIPAGHTLGFVVDSVASGSLTITHLGSTTPVVAGTTVVLPGDTLTWTSPAGATGVNNAFSIRAVDVTTTLTSTDAVQVQVNLINFAPTLTTVTTFTGGVQQTPFDITYAALAGAANEFDANNDALSFRIEAISSGTLQITHLGLTNVAVAGTLVVPGDTLTWKPADGVSGNGLAAFTITAFDGLLASSPPVQVRVDVIPFGGAFDLSGPWVANGKLARINQTGTTLLFSDENNTGSNGTFIGANTITGRGGLTGVIDTTTPDIGRIVWSDGVVWLRIALGGQYYNPANNALTSLSQAQVSITMNTAFSGSSTGTFLNATTFTIPGFGLTGTIRADGVQFSNGVFWKKLNLSPTFTNPGGQTTKVKQDGTTTLLFTNAAGGTSTGFWIDPTHVRAPDPAFGNLTGTVINDTIQWSNGALWRVALTAIGTPAAGGQVSIQATNGKLFATNKFGGVSRMQLTSTPNTYNLLDFGLTATLSNGTLFFSNGAQWSLFDNNALDAIFASIKTPGFGV